MKIICEMCSAERLRFLIALGVILCLVLSLLSALIPANTVQAQLASAPWPMFGQNLQHSGRSPYSGPEIPVLKWSFTTGGAVCSSPAIGADGSIYVGSDDGRLYAIKSDGTLKWGPYIIFYEFSSSPAIGADGTIYVGSWDNKLYAVNPDGTLKWSYTTDGPVESSPAIGADGTIYVGSNDDRLYAINSSGNLTWRYITNGDVHCSPAIGADGTIYVGSNGYKLYAINPEGTLNWSYTTGGPVKSSLAIGADDTVYVGLNDGKLYALYSTNGTEKWSFPVSGPVESSPAMGADGTIYVGSNDNKLYAITNVKEGGGGGWGPCFIATAAYGTPMAEEIQILREFRDEYLLTNAVGQALVDVYYRVSPPIAEFITEHPSLKPIVRAGLLPAVAMSTIAVNTTPVEKIVLVGLLVLGSVAVAIWLTRRRGRDPEYI